MQKARFMGGLAYFRAQNAPMPKFYTSFLSGATISMKFSFLGY
jgi:hypothetical protein